MNKRHFLMTGALLGATLPARALAAPSRARTGPCLLTVTGEIGRSRHGPVRALEGAARARAGKVAPSSAPVMRKRRLFIQWPPGSAAASARRKGASMG